MWRCKIIIHLNFDGNPKGFLTVSEGPYDVLVKVGGINKIIKLVFMTYTAKSLCSITHVINRGRG